MTIAACVLLVLSSPKDYFKEFVLSKANKVSCSVSATESARPAIQMVFTRDNKQRWTVSQRTEGPLNAAPKARVVGKSGIKILILSLAIPNWNETWVWVAGQRKSEPLVIRYQASEPNVLVPTLRRDGAVSSIVTYDKWIGGTTLPKKRNGRTLDRRERVTTYLVTATGLKTKLVRTRLIEAHGGGPEDRNHVYLHSTPTRGRPNLH